MMSIFSLALSPENIRGGPILPGLCKLNWDLRAQGGGAIQAEGSTSEPTAQQEKMMCLRN